jgi:prolyl 4-hydroxylase
MASGTRWRCPIVVVMCLWLGLLLPTAAFSTHHNRARSWSTTTALHDSSAFWGTERSPAEIEAHVHARLAATNSRGDWKEEAHRVEVLSAEPPLVLIHNFLSPTLCHEIVTQAAASPFMKRSTTGESFEQSHTRTSATVWLRDEDCPHPLRVVADQVAALTGVPHSFMENLQVCHYLPGQEFQVHTDHQNSFNEAECRGRIATCLLYLSAPEEGGETWFPGLGDDAASEPRIAPSVGAAVFFWNTLERPGSPGYEPHMYLNADLRLRHAGLPVVQGEKWICNRWVHPIDVGKTLGARVRGVHPPPHVATESAKESV